MINDNYFQSSLYAFYSFLRENALGNLFKAYKAVIWQKKKLEATESVILLKNHYLIQRK